MKKIIFCLMTLLIITIPVSAKENKLYFTEENNRLYYDSALFDEDVFLKHTDMVPGSSYSDELIIENGTNTEYTLYFKVVPRNQSAESDELLNNITMKIYLDDEEIYDGKALGLDYKNQGVNLQNAFLIGNIGPNERLKMIVNTKLLESYSNTDYNEMSYIDWSFYAQYDNDDQIIEIIESPDTLKNKSPIIMILSILVILVGIGVLIYGLKKEK